MKYLLMLAIVVGLCAGCSSSAENTVPVLNSESSATTSAPESSTFEPEPAPTAAPMTTEVPPADAGESTEANSASDSTESAEAEAEAAEASVEVELATAVRAYFDAREAASSGPAPNPDDPRLPEVAASPELERLIQSVQDKADAGEAIRPGEQDLAEIRVGFVEAAGDFASVAACSVDDGVIFDVATGGVVNDDVVTHNYRIDLALLSGVWKVTEIVRVQQWEGVGGCALATGDYPY